MLYAQQSKIFNRYLGYKYLNSLTTIVLINHFTILRPIKSETNRTKEVRITVVSTYYFERRTILDL